MAASSTRSYMMAAEAAAEIVSQKLDILLSRLEWVGCLAMETLVKDAKAQLAKIREFVSTRDRPSKSMEWSGRLLQAMYDAEEFIDKFHLKVARGRHEALHIATRPLAALVHSYMLWRDLSKLVKALKELCQDQYLSDKETTADRKKDPASSSSHASSAPWEGQKLVRLTTFWDRQVSTNFVCHKRMKMDLKNRIKEESEDVHLISIWGEQGTGKTFFARWIYWEAMYLGFNARAWVHVSASMDQQEFLFEILKQVDKLARGVMDSHEITEMLSQKLAETKRFLIVLDDVQPSHYELLEGLLMIIQPFSSKGHIITTTQDHTVAWIMSSGGNKSIKLENLGEEEKRTMLAMKLHRPSLTTEEDKILNRFPALPLYISLLGGLLSHAKGHETAGLGNDDSKMSVSDLIELSYHILPVHLKPCFIYMALFPMASPIPTRRLVRLWLAEGLLYSHCYDGERKRTPEEVGETFILELAARNVIDVVSWRADGSPKACQMLTSLYDLICQTTMGTGFFHVHYAGKSKGRNDHNPSGQQQQPPDTPRQRTNVRWLTEHTNIVKDGRSGSYPDLNLSHVRSFLSFYLRRGVVTKDINTFLRNMTSKVDYSLLRVLDLEGVYKPSLQGVLRKLVLLKYLGLRSTVLESIPNEVADLHYLETLDIKHTNITSLPSSLWKVRNLRHLHLSWFYIDLMKILKVCGNNVMALTKLQSLNGVVTGVVKENSMTGHMNSLITLTTLKLYLQHSDKGTSSGAAGETVAHWVSSRLTNLQSLTFGVIHEAKPAKKATKEAEPATLQIGLLPQLALAQHHQLFELYLLGQLNEPIWTKLLPGSLRVLTLSGSMLDEDMMPELGGLLRNLRTLRLLVNSFLCESMSFVKDGFPSLKILKIWKLPKLARVIIQQGAMPHLQELDFRHLESLQTVEGINECNELENIFVISQSKALVDQLERQIGKTKNLHFEQDTNGRGSTNDDGDKRDKKTEMTSPPVEKDTKRPQSANDDGSPSNVEDARH